MSTPTTTPPPDITDRADEAAAKIERAQRRVARRAAVAKRVERQFYNIPEFSVVTGRDPAIVARWVKNGVVKSTKVGGSRLIPVSEAERLKGGAPS